LLEIDNAPEENSVDISHIDVASLLDGIDVSKLPDNFDASTLMPASHRLPKQSTAATAAAAAITAAAGRDGDTDDESDGDSGDGGEGSIEGLSEGDSSGKDSS
jgi:hypothetical protein